MAERRKYVDISGLSHAEVLAALYSAAGSTGLGAVRMLAGALKGEPDELTPEAVKEILRRSEIFRGVFVDYVNGRRMKLFFCDKEPNRLDVGEYDRFTNVPAKDTIAALRAKRGSHVA